jgi:hypothetical protein
MKKTILTSVLSLFGAMAFAQATLPSTENFTGFTGTGMQTGWSFNNVTGTSFTYTSGGPSGAPSGKMDATGEYVQAHVGGQMGPTTFYLWGTGAAPWNGTFNVRESVDGTNWTNISTYTNNLPSSFTQYTVTPSASARYIRWEFTLKLSGYNVGIDDINITAGVAATSDINVKYNTTSVLSGGATPIFGASVGTPTPINFSVENTGLSTLNVSSVSFTGADAADFSVTSPAGPFSVNATSNSPLVVSFNPSASGTRVADMIIANDDADESSYVIHLNAVGGTLSSEPTGQASGLTFNTIKSYRAKYAFSAAAGSVDGYIVLRKTSSSPITDFPLDGTWYDQGDMIGNSKVYYVGNSLNNTLMNIWADTDYQLAVFTYNGSGTFTNYNTTNPALNGFTSSNSMMPTTEYSTVSTAAPTFITDLHNKINTHSFVFYSNYAGTMISLFEATDTINGQKYVECAYSSYRAVYTPPFDWSATDFSREHTFPHTWMPTFPADNPEKPEYNDQHMIYPTKFVDVNEERSNLPLGEVITIQNVFMDGKSGLNALGKKVYEPRDKDKGNAARAIMYQSVCYTGVSGNLWNLPNPISPTLQYGQDQEVLKAWHYQDPPDAYEIARNDFLDSIQGNRNPFIDSMHYACFIDFYTMTKIPNVIAPCGSFVGVNSIKNTFIDFSVFPNPSSGSFSYLVNTENGNYELNISDLSGRSIYKKQIETKSGKLYGTVSDVILNSGIYFIEISSDKGKWVKKLVIQE